MCIRDSDGGYSGRKQDKWQRAAFIKGLRADGGEAAGRGKKYPVQLIVPSEAVVRDLLQTVGDIELSHPVAFGEGFPAQLLYCVGKTDLFQILTIVESFAFDGNEIPGKLQGIDFILAGEGSGGNHEIAGGDNRVLGIIAAGGTSGQHLMGFDYRIIFRHKKLLCNGTVYFPAKDMKIRKSELPWHPLLPCEISDAEKKGKW